jgi:hypothetical protein
MNCYFLFGESRIQTKALKVVVSIRTEMYDKLSTIIKLYLILTWNAEVNLLVLKKVGGDSWVDI